MTAPATPPGDVFTLRVRHVIGRGDVFDAIMLVPLIVDWRVPRNCVVALRGDRCDRPLSRLYVLAEPVDGHAVVGVCEHHHKELTREKEGT